mmetsp:Transcript_22463/g.48790  ORF Transcript_22463/g.48790 Transcript_22463/m.48790 type:complete len:270 (-) Transcript_22463:49-858(-)
MRPFRVIGGVGSCVAIVSCIFPSETHAHTPHNQHEAPYPSRRRHQRHMQRPNISNISFRRKEQYARKRACTAVAFVDPTSSALGSITAFSKAHPYYSAFSIAAFKGGLADVVAQRSESSEPDAAGKAGGKDTVKVAHDYRRSLVFVIYGGLYQGMALELLYNNLFNDWFGENILAKIIFNQLVLTPFVTLPAAYLAKGIVFGKTLSDVMKDYYYDVKENGLLTAFWKLWTPVNLLLFSVIPPHFRVAFCALVSFVWTIILSRISNSDKG